MLGVETKTIVIYSFRKDLEGLRPLNYVFYRAIMKRIELAFIAKQKYIHDS